MAPPIRKGPEPVAGLPPGERVKDPRPARGLRGEEAARRHLEGLGWSILAIRWRTRFGEIDLVADDGSAVVFVEVKCRRGLACGPPEESVTPLKQRRLVRLAEGFLQARRLPGRGCRFDVIAADESPDGAVRIRHIRDAFRG